jgi:hypothetical protein
VRGRYPLAWGTTPGTVVLPVLRANGTLDRLKEALGGGSRAMKTGYVVLGLFPNAAYPSW